MMMIIISHGCRLLLIDASHQIAANVQKGKNSLGKKVEKQKGKEKKRKSLIYLNVALSQTREEK